MHFPKELLLPQKTICRKGAVLTLAKEVARYGPCGLIVHGRSLEASGWRKRIAQQFSDRFTIGFHCRESGEPTLAEISAIIAVAKHINATWIAGIGGGSVLDVAKAVAGLFNASEEPRYYQHGGRLKHYGIPFIAVPTTAGTGSEATPNAVIIDSEKRAKLSIRDKSFLPRTVILDVELLKSVPPAVLSYAGMDALIQAYESFISKNATWFSETFALKAIELVNNHILPAYTGRKEDDLEPLLLGSYFAGLAFASSRLGVIHGIAHPLGVMYNVPHGLVCSVCFIPSIKLNRIAMGSKYETISEVMDMDFVERVVVLLAKLKIRSPFAGKQIIEKENIIAATLASGSTAANPKLIERDDVEHMLEEIFKKAS